MEQSTQSEARPFNFRRDSLQLAGDVWGPESTAGGDAPVVLLHGGGQTRHSWDRTARRLAADGRTAVIVDARGHGDSDWDPDGDYSLTAFAADLTVLLELLPAPAIVVGASLGGVTALRVAGEHPELMAGLVLVDVVVRVAPEGVKRIRDFMTARPEGYCSLEEVADAVAAYNPNRPRPRSFEGLRKNVKLGEDGRWHWHWDPAFMRIGNEPQRDIEPDRLEELAKLVRVPTMLVRGGASDVVTDAGVEHILQLIPDARVFDVNGAGHMVAGDDNDVFAIALEQFIEEVG
ncbi:MAG TPA: alpha/beta hydrolase [Solirubrobacterales bacterium]|jgi:non-heme chloroperoxidase|nr:alpha/beta hydrolase [Solirubrobacterales bacterium]